MSRFIITIKGKDGRRDESGVIGYDKLMRTYFVQGFPDSKDEGYLGFWVGERLEEFKSLDALVEHSRQLGFELVGITEDMRKSMVQEQQQPKVKCVAEQHGLVY